MSDTEIENEEDLTTQYHDGADSSTEEDEQESELETETVAIEKSVAAASDSLKASVTAELDDELRARVVTASTLAAENPGEAIRDSTSTSPRLAALTTRLDKALAEIRMAGFNVGTAHAAFLETVLGIDVPGGDTEERAEAATTSSARSSKRSPSQRRRPPISPRSRPHSRLSPTRTIGASSRTTSTVRPSRGTASGTTSSSWA